MRTKRVIAMATAFAVLGTMTMTASATGLGWGHNWQGGKKNCPCFTGEMIDAGLIMVGNEGTTGGKSCSLVDPTGNEFDVIIAFDNLTDTSPAKVVAKASLGDGWGAKGSCEFHANSGAWPLAATPPQPGDLDIVELNTLTRVEAYECKKELLKSLSWSRFCAE